MKIHIIGSSGVGKSTLAKKLSRALDIPHIELDQLYFEPNWVKRPVADFTADVEQACQAPAWVSCGNYSSMPFNPSTQADVIIWLDLPLFKTWRRLFWRTLKRLWTQEEICNGNREILTKQLFSRTSIWWWVVRTHNKRKLMYLEMMRHSDRQWLVSTSDNQTNQIFEQLITQQRNYS